jgi:hypothetical protein
MSVEGKEIQKKYVKGQQTIGQVYLLSTHRKSLIDSISCYFLSSSIMYAIIGTIRAVPIAAFPA